MPDVTTTQPRRGTTELHPRWRATLGDYVVALGISADGQLCVIGAGDGRVVGLDVTSGRELFAVHAHHGGVLDVSIAPDGSRFATCGPEPTAKIWSRTGALIRELPGTRGTWVEHVAWSPAGARLAIAAGRRFRVCGPDGEPMFDSDTLPSTVTGLTWRDDGTSLAAICYGGVHIVPFVAGAKPRTLAWKGSLISIAWSPDGKVVACGSQDSSVHFWRMASGHDSQMSGYPFKPKALAWDHESKLLATGGDATITTWDFRGKGPENTHPIVLAAHKGVCTQLAFRPRSGVLASGSQDTSVLLWDPRRGAQEIGFAFLDDEVTALVWDRTGRALAGADASGGVTLWEVA